MKHTRPLFPGGLLLLLAIGCGPRDRSPEGLWTHYCRDCHGDEGRGGTELPIDLYPKIDLLRSNRERPLDRAALRERIEQGWGPMPPYRNKLSPLEIDQLTDLVVRLHLETEEDPDGP